MWPMGLSRHIPDLGWLPWGKPRLYKQKGQFLIAFMRIHFFRSQRSSVFTLLSYLNRLLLRISLCNSLFQIRTLFLDPGVTYLDWKRSSGWLESWEGLLLGNWRFDNQCQLWRWLPHRLLKLQSTTTVLLRTPFTQMICFNLIKLRSAERTLKTSTFLASYCGKLTLINSLTFIR